MSDTFVNLYSNNFFESVPQLYVIGGGKMAEVLVNGFINAGNKSMLKNNKKLIFILRFFFKKKCFCLCKNTKHCWQMECMCFIK